MSEWSGEVSKFAERDWGTKKIYSWQLKGANLWFRCNDERTKLEIGQCYSFSGESPNKVDWESVKIIDEAELKKAASSSTSNKEVPPTTSPDYWRWKQMHDLARQEYFDWRDARADATRIVCAALDNDVLSLGQKKGLKLDMLIGQVKETTAQLLEKENG